MTTGAAERRRGGHGIDISAVDRSASPRRPGRPAQGGPTTDEAQARDVDAVRAAVRREQELAASVRATQAELADAIAERDSVLAAQDRVVAARRARFAEAVHAYVGGSGLGRERAAVVLGRSPDELERILRQRAVD